MSRGPLETRRDSRTGWRLGQTELTHPPKPLTLAPTERPGFLFGAVIDTHGAAEEVDHAHITAGQLPHGPLDAPLRGISLQ